MISTFQLIRNIGKFESVNSGDSIPFTHLTLIYAENGRGKTTLAAILRSLATGDPILIIERHKLDAQHPPHVVINCEGGPPHAMFENSVWNRTLPNIAVFDDAFVDQNIFSGLEVQAEHRQNLHEIILGVQGVVLGQQIQSLASLIESHNTELRRKAAAIPEAIRGELSVDQFCALSERVDIDAEIQEAERSLAAATEQESVRNTSQFDLISLPAFNIQGIGDILQQDLPFLDVVAANHVQSHIARLGNLGEAWVSDGMHYIQENAVESLICPFCTQDIRSVTIIDQYRSYFSDSYVELKRLIATTLSEINTTHGGDIPAAFERIVRIAGERGQFWSQFCDVPEIAIDTALIIRVWREVREFVTSVLSTKLSAPLERIRLPDLIEPALAEYETQRQALSNLNRQFEQANERILLVKERAAENNRDALRAHLVLLKSIKARHTPSTIALCDSYIAEKRAKSDREGERDQLKAELDLYKESVFPSYQTAINVYLNKFNAGFRLCDMNSVNTRGGPACSYNVIINGIPVPISRGTSAIGNPSFKNTLSAGDRNTLALAFFFASLDQDPELENKIVVIDDPMTSLDEHRTLTTIQEVRRLAERAGQVVVLSHNRSFLCRIWNRADTTIRTAIEVVREGEGSTMRVWNVNEDSITEHDRRHTILRQYLENSSPQNREVARSIRPVLEAFLRVAYPGQFPPGTLLGQFLYLCTQRLGISGEILNVSDTQELRDLIEYTNRFHHDSNPAWESESINDGELASFVRRALNFTTRRS